MAGISLDRVGSHSEREISKEDELNYACQSQTQEISSIPNRGQLPESYLEQVKKNKPQNFNIGQKMAKMREDEYFCNRGCGAILKKGASKKQIQESQTIHNNVCPVEIKHQQEMKRYKEVWSNPTKPKLPTVAPVIDACAWDEELSIKSNRTCFQYGVGLFKLKSKRSHEKRRSYLVDIDKLEKLGKVTRKDHYIGKAPIIP